MTRPRLDYDHPPCASSECGAAVRRRDGESLYGFKARRCCSAECGRRYTNDLLAVRAAAHRRKLEAAHLPCAICGGAVVFRRREESTRFAVRQTCGRVECIRAIQVISAKAADRAVPHAHYPDAPAVVAAPETVAGEYGAGFGAHTLHFKPDNRPMPPRPFNRSYGVSGIWGTRGAG